VAMQRRLARAAAVSLAVVMTLGAFAFVLGRLQPAENQFVVTNQNDVFSRPWVAGCVTGKNVYLVGRGMLARYDGVDWWHARLAPAVDLRAVACRDGFVAGVGTGGRIAQTRSASAQVDVERIADANLWAVGLVDDGTVYAVGDDETIVAGRTGAWSLLRQSPGGRTLFSISVRARDEVWIGTGDATVVVFDGRSYKEHLIPEMCFNGKDRCGHDVTAIAPYGVRMAVAAARVYAFPPLGDLELVWKPGADIRSLFSPDGERIYIVADDGLTVVRGVAPRHTAETNLPRGLDCPLRAVFGGDARDVWLLAAGERSGLAHFDGVSWRTIQGC
jgi:hypothetical protein